MNITYLNTELFNFLSKKTYKICHILYIFTLVSTTTISMQTKLGLNKLEVSGFVIERTSKRMKQRFQELLKSKNVGVTVDQWIVLQVVGQFNGLNQFEIGQKIYKDAPTLTRILDLLHKKEMIERSPNPEDRRRLIISLTKFGEQKVKEIIPLTKLFRKTAWQGLTNEEISKMESVLNKVFSNIQNSII